MSTPQPGILAPLPSAARFLTFQLGAGVDPAVARATLGALAPDPDRIVGIGAPFVHALGASIEGLRLFPALCGPGAAVPSTPAALWCRVAGADPGACLHAADALVAALAPSFALESAVDGYVHDGGRDLTGYEDGTENPVDAAAVAAAIVSGQGEGRDGGSFVSVQRWVHDFGAFRAMSPDAQDACIGRRRTDNDELDDAPASAHVRRTAQESFTPAAFVVRRSMPWHDATGAGLVFVAFGATVDPFEALLRRMVGLEDGVVDALFRFTRPVTGAHFWCPPLREGRLDLSALG